MSKPGVLAIDAGGTNLRLAAMTADGEMLACEHHAWRPQTLDNDALLRALAAAIEPLRQRHAPAAIGIGFPGFLHDGVLRSSPNMPRIRDLPLAARLAAMLGLPVAAENDALCAAIGEHACGAGAQTPHLLHLTLGTGIGAGLILHGKPWRGAHGMAMEFGHLIVDRSEQAARCGCGNRGCVETLASASAVLARFRSTGGKAASAAEVARLAEAGDAMAARVFAQAGEALGAAIAEAAKLLDIAQVSIGGGLANGWALFAPAMQAALEHALIPPLRARIRIVRSALGDRAGLLGAGLLGAGLLSAKGLARNLP